MRAGLVVVAERWSRLAENEAGADRRHSRRWRQAGAMPLGRPWSTASLLKRDFETSSWLSQDPGVHFDRCLLGPLLVRCLPCICAKQIRDHRTQRADPVQGTALGKPGRCFASVTGKRAAVPKPWFLVSSRAWDPKERLASAAACPKQAPL